MTEPCKRAHAHRMLIYSHRFDNTIAVNCRLCGEFFAFAPIKEWQEIAESMNHEIGGMDQSTSLKKRRKVINDWLLENGG